MRAGFGGGQGIGGDVPNLVLAFLHAADVIGQGDGLLAAGVVGALMSRIETQQLEDGLAVGVVLHWAFLQHHAEVLPHLGIFLAVFLRHFGQMGQDPLGDAGADGVNGLVGLQDLAGDVQGQVVGIDHAANETQITGHQLFGVVHDEHALHVQLDAVHVVPIPEVEGRLLGQVEQGDVAGGAFHPVVQYLHGLFEVVGDVFVELVVFLVLDLGFGTSPKGGGLVDGLPPIAFGRLVLVVFAFFLVIRLGGRLALEQNGHGDVVGVFLDDVANAPIVQEFGLILFQMQHHFGAALFAFDILQGETAAAIGFPTHALIGPGTGPAGDDRDLVGDDEGGIEADAELADELGVLFLVAGEIFQEFTGAGGGDGADVVDHFLAAHADAVVGDGYGLGVLVHGDVDLEIAVVTVEGVVPQGFET